MADCLEHAKVEGDNFIESHQADVKELESKLKENVIGSSIERNQEERPHNAREDSPEQKNTTTTASSSDPPGEDESPLEKSCDECTKFKTELDELKGEKNELEKQLSALKKRIQTVNGELEREVLRRCDMEQKFTEEAKRSTDQIDELITKSNQDNVRLADLKRKFDLYSHETSAMIESFTTNREVLTSQILQLRQENDYLLGKYIGKSRDLQNEEINLPQTVEELQFHCLTLNEKLILATLAKEQLEETLVHHTTHTIN